MKVAVRAVRRALQPMYHERWLLLQFFRREVSSRYAGSAAGALWAFVHPLLQLAIYAIVFAGVFRVRLPPDQNHAYLLFVAVALWPWLAFQESVLRGSQAVTNNAALVKKIPFSHELLVAAAVSATFSVQLLGYLIVLASLAAFGYVVYLSGVFWVIVLLPALFMLSLGIALALAALHVFVRDVEQVLAHGLSLMFYLSPVLYSSRMTPPWLASLMKLNPLSHYLEAIRAALLDGVAPPPGQLLAMLGISVAVLLAGWALFRRMSPHFEDAL